MKLYLVRHATAVDGIGGAIRTDAERPLVNKGKAEAHSVALALRKLGARPDVFVTSPLVRAHQTAKIFAEIFGVKEEKIVISEALAPGGKIDDLYRELGKGKHAGEVCLFGHEPDMTLLAERLLLTAGELNMPLKKAGVCRIDISDLPPAAGGTLKWLITPKIAEHIAQK